MEMATDTVTRILPSEVLELIFANLERADLLNIRLVCEDWNKDCLKFFKTSSKFRLTLNYKNSDDYIKFVSKIFPGTDGQQQQHQHQLEPVMLIHLKFEILDEDDYDSDISDDESDDHDHGEEFVIRKARKLEEFIAKVSKLQTLFGSECIRDLTFIYPGPYENGFFEKLIKILSNLSPALEKLVFCLNSDFPLIDQQEEWIVFSKVKYLSFDWCQEISRQPGVTTTYFKTSWKLIQACLNLETLVIGNRPSPQARLDRIYVSGSFLAKIKSFSTLPSFADHAVVGLKLESQITSSCYWKMPFLILNNIDFISECKMLLEDFIHCEHKTLKTYELLKWNIKQMITLKLKVSCHLQREELNNISSQYADCHQVSSETSRLLFGKLLESSTVSSTILNPELQIRKIKVRDSDLDIPSVFSDLNKFQLTRVVHAFFLDEMQNDSVESEGLNAYLQDLPKISDSEMEKLNLEISTDEIRTAMSQLQNGASPGLDGFISEFYKVFVNEYVRILKWLWNESILQGILPTSLRTGLVTLIYKKDDPKSLKNWRPITMSTSEYKIFANVLKNRFVN